ncbi:phosphatase PAP2 family protein [Altericroceibacterium xinjiangense]|uniref:phosphatase PAP2 family protein n=1 Tax=Altericroceibacterium xinjiangense TaxID=762261 RepID=UPI0013DF9468|nr:phosphatase PAP2 family protein [Altericroceibacterium xinjiangense]
MRPIPFLSEARRSQLSPPERADIAILRKMEPAIRSKLGYWTGKIGNLADEPPLRAFAAGCFAIGVFGGHARLRRAALRMLAAHTLATAVKTVGKNNIDRSRPMALLDDKRYLMASGHSHEAALQSFPSGHTAGSVAVAHGFTQEYPRHGAAAYGVAATLGFLQIFRRAHFPGDVLAGAVVGMAAGAIADALLTPILGE